MKTRVLTAVVGIPLLLIVASLGGWWFFTLGLLAAVIALYEFHGFAAGLARERKQSIFCTFTSATVWV